MIQEDRKKEKERLSIFFYKRSVRERLRILSSHLMAEQCLSCRAFYIFMSLSAADKTEGQNAMEYPHSTFSFCDHHQQRQVENFSTPRPPARHQLVAAASSITHRHHTSLYLWLAAFAGREKKAE